MEPNRTSQALPVGRDAPPQQGRIILPAHHRAPFGHARLLPVVLRKIPVGKGCDGPVAFQHQDATVLLGKRQGRLPPDRGQWPPLPQPEKFPRREGSPPSAKLRLVSRTSICSATAFMPVCIRTNGAVTCATKWQVRTSVARLLPAPDQ